MRQDEQLNLEPIAFESKKQLYTCRHLPRKQQSWCGCLHDGDQKEWIAHSRLCKKVLSELRTILELENNIDQQTRFVFQAAWETCSPGCRAGCWGGAVVAWSQSAPLMRQVLSTPWYSVPSALCLSATFILRRMTTSGRPAPPDRWISVQASDSPRLTKPITFSALPRICSSKQSVQGMKQDSKAN